MGRRRRCAPTRASAPSSGTGRSSGRTAQRIALAVAEHQGSEYALSTLQRTAREAGLGLDEIALAREFDSHDEHEAVLLRFVKALLQSDGAPQLHILEEAREAGWTDEQILEAVAQVALARSRTSSPAPPTCPWTARAKGRDSSQAA